MMSFLPATRLLPLLIIVCVIMLGSHGYDFWSNWNNPNPQPLTWGRGALAEEPAHTPTSTENSPTDSAHETSATAAAPTPTPAVAPTASSASASSSAAPKPAEPDVAERREALPMDFSPAEVEVLQNLAKRRDELDKRAHSLDQREALLTAAETRIEDKVKELEALREEIKGLIGQVDSQEQARLQSLVKIYQTMKPREAAAILEGLEMNVTLDVLEKMQETKSAPILASMNPQKASEITVEMSRRHQIPALPE